MSKYRPNSALVLQNQAGQLLVGERRDFPGCWQFPQGGREEGETAEQALHREMMEEIGLRPHSYRVLRCAGPFRYDFPEGIRKKGCVGQEQTVFLARLIEDSALLEGNLGKEQSPEFRALRWVRPEEFEPEWVPAFKHAVYRQIFAQFFPQVVNPFEEA